VRVVQSGQPQQRVVLGSLMSEFSPYAQSPDVATAGEMKASSDFYSDEGAAPKGPAQAWTGDGGAAFNYLQSEASSPIEEAEQDRQSTLDGDNPDADDDTDLYGSWGGDGRSRRGRERHDDELQRLRQHEKDQRSAQVGSRAGGGRMGGGGSEGEDAKCTNTFSRARARAQNARACTHTHTQDKQFFAGVSKVFGKKTGKFLMDKFDPQRKKDKKSKTRRRQVRVSVRWSDGGERVRVTHAHVCVCMCMCVCVCVCVCEGERDGLRVFV